MLAAAPDFAELPASWLSRLLASDELDLPEIAAFDALATWLNAQEPPAPPALRAELLSLVRFPLIPAAVLRRHVEPQLEKARPVSATCRSTATPPPPSPLPERRTHRPFHLWQDACGAKLLLEAYRHRSLPPELHEAAPRTTPRANLGWDPGLRFVLGPAQVSADGRAVRVEHDPPGYSTCQFYTKAAVLRAEIVWRLRVEFHDGDGAEWADHRRERHRLHRDRHHHRPPPAPTSAGLTTLRWA